MSDFTDLRSAFESELKALNEAVTAIAKDGVEVSGSNVAIDEKGYNEVVRIRKNVAELKTLMETQAEYKDLAEWLNDPEKKEESKRFTPVTTRKGISEGFVESNEFKNAIDNGTFRSVPYAVEVADIVAEGAKDVYSSLYGYSRAHNIGTVSTELPWVQPPQLRQRVRDLFPVNRTRSNLIEFFRVLEMANDGRGSAAPVADYSAGNFGLKPKSTLSFESDSAQVRTIAHWVAVHRNTLADKAQIRSVIDNQLLYGLALVEDDQLLNGSGTGENIRGLLQTPGIQTYTAGAGELKSDSLRRAQTLSTLALFPATGYVLHPSDWEDVELQKGTSNDHYMLVSNVSVGAASRVWRLPVVESPSITEGTFLTGAFGQAAQVWDREAASIRLSDSHADYFVRNAVAILAEERLALTVTAPSAIVKGTFAA